METKESPYYMGNRDLLPIVIETEYNGIVMTHELPWDAGGERIMLAFYSSLVTYFGNEETLNVFADYAKRVNPYESKHKIELKSDFRISIKSDNNVLTTIVRKNWGITCFDVMRAFHGALLALTWDYDQVYDMIGEFAAEYIQYHVHTENETKEEEN